MCHNLSTEIGNDLLTFYICSSCDYTCTNSSNLKKHVRTHTGEKPYVCHICDYNCCDSSNLKKHMKKHNIGEEQQHETHHGNINSENLSPYDTQSTTHLRNKRKCCILCDYTCTRGSDLKRHIRTHTGEKPFVCNICDYRTLDKGNLTKHLRRHTGESPYKCRICEHTCRDSSNFKKHIRRHTGDKPYACSLCDFRSACSANLKSHMRRHLGDKPYSCDICDYKSACPANLNSHIKKVHDVVLKPQTLFCDKATDMKIHIKTHIGNPYAWSESDIKYYGDGEKLRDHVDQNNPDTSGKKHITCSLCDFKTFLHNDLKRHLETHTEYILQNFKHFLDI